MKIEIELDCAECCRAQTLTYVDEELSVNFVILNFVLAQFRAIGWETEKESKCPVCVGKMTEQEYERKYCQPHQDLRIEVKTDNSASSRPYLKIIK